MIVITGAGIAGLTLGLTLHQIGIPFRIYERVSEMRPLGVGINLQPNAVRELFDLGLQPMLDRVGLRTREYGFFTTSGREIWAEPRGMEAGYEWPQFSIHRGHLQTELHAELLRRAGPDAVVLGAPALGSCTRDDKAVLLLDTGDIEADLLVACDGIHSAIRAGLNPQEGPPIWSGAILWRATSQAPPFRTGASMCLAGHDTQRIVAYPITPPDPETGLVTMNWIAERKFDPATPWRREDWTRAADPADFAPQFETWDFGWLNVPDLIRRAGKIYEYPMVDRDPLDRWTNGRVTLMGDAAHPTYPVGSNGASQAIVDARFLGKEILNHGTTPAALLDYEAQMRPRTNGVVMANRGSGPDAILQRVHDLCGGVFERIEDVIPHHELKAHADGYKALAGVSVADVNAAPPLIDPSHYV